MKKKINIIYDKTLGNDRVVIGTDTYNFVVIQGPKEATQLMSKDRYRTYYTNIRSLIQGLYDKRIKTHFDTLTLSNLEKAIKSAYTDVIDISRGIDKAAKNLITRT